MAISRRGLLALGALLAAGVLGPASGQQGTKIHRVGFLASTSPLTEITGRNPANPFVRAFVEGLRERGYVEGRNVLLMMRTLEGKPERLDAVLMEFGREKVEVIFLPSPYMVVRATKIVPTMPIVALVGSDLFDKGVVQSAARPAGNVTGPSADVDQQVEAKRLELLLEIQPKLTRVAYVGTSEEWARPYGEHVRQVGRRRGVTVIHVASEYADFAPAFARLAESKAQAVFIERSPRAYGRREQIGELALRSGLPSACSQSELADHGCLMSYGADNLHMARRVSDYMDRILKGARAGDLPVESRTKFELVINLKTARALNMSIPKSVLLRADRVIE